MKAALAALAVAVLIAGCGSDGGPSAEDRATETAERFAVAIGAGDLETVCGMFTPALRQEFTWEGVAECEDSTGPGSLGDPVFDGLTVAGVAVDGPSADVTFRDSPVTLELVEVDGQWQVSEVRG